MCVVGYDDSRFGGAFEIQNSWGDRWGRAGYTWIAYEAFGQFVDEAYEIIEDLSAYRDATEYSGFVEIEIFGSGRGMPVRFSGQGYYQTRFAYPSGTEFRFIMGNNHPAYVYAFAADDSSVKTTRIFPPEDRNVSPVLDYSKNAVAWPGEDAWIQLDDVTGSDYLVVLYSKQALDIDAIRGRFERERGPFPQRVARAVGPDFIPHDNAKYDYSKISFTGSMVNNRAVLGLLLAISHSAEGIVPVDMVNKEN
jgi:hypothetical protein